MCRPDPRQYGVYYAINPQMKETLDTEVPVIYELAIVQWEALRKMYEEEGLEVVLIPQAPNLPDMVFVANAGLVYGNTFVLSKFRFDKRRGEEPYYEDFFRRAGFTIKIIKDGTFEGHGDALFYKNTLVCGVGIRSDERGVHTAAEAIEHEPIVVQLQDEHFYHLDTCFCPSDPILYYPQAFDAPSRRVIERLGETIAVSKEDADRYVCNSTPIQHESHTKLIGPAPMHALRKKLEVLGMTVRSPGPVSYVSSQGRIIKAHLSEFLKAGGSVRCLTLFF